MVDYTKKTIFLGIDVHKSTCSVTAICDGAIVKRDKLPACPERFVGYCHRHFKGAQIKSAYEAGFSGFHLHRFLVDNGIENIVVHAASVEISSRDLVKTDKRDSLKIATQLSCNRLRCVYIPPIEGEHRRGLTRLREAFVKQKTRTACQLKSLLHANGLIPFNKTFPISDKTIQKLEKLKVNENLKYAIRGYSQTWRYFQDQVKQTNKEIEKSISDKRLKELYCSLPGIGITAGSILMNELGDTLQFSNEQKLCSHAGLTPREYSSGEHKRQGHITQQGKPILRRILVQAAWKAIKKDPSLKVNFERIAKRAGKKRAIIAIARTLLIRIRSCIKRNECYVIGEIDLSDASKEA